MHKVAYEPISAKEALKQIKNLCSVIVDLAFSSIIFEDKDLAEEIKELRNRVIHLDYLLTMTLQIAVHDSRDAQATLPLVAIGQASIDIANSATDVANVLLKGFSVHQSIKDLAYDMLRGEISDESILKGYSLSKINEKMHYSVTIYAVRREGKWNTKPNQDMILQSGDIVLAGGSISGIGLLKLLVSGKAEEIASLIEEEEDDIKTEIVQDNIFEYLRILKDSSEVMVDLAYGAVLYNNKELAQLVFNMEKRIDTIRNKAELTILRLAKSSTTEDLTSLQGLFRIVEATEDISDSANQIASTVLAELPSHPIIELIIGESSESIFEKIVEESSLIINKMVPPGNYLDEFGIRVLALKRSGGHYFKPRRTKIKAGDTVIFTGPRDACNAFQKREEKAIERKEADLVASKKAAELVVKDLVQKVTDEASGKAAKDASKKTVDEISIKAAEKATEKVASKAVTEAASEAAEKVLQVMIKKLVSEVAKETLQIVKSEQQQEIDKEAEKTLIKAIEDVANKAVEDSMKKVTQAAMQAAKEKLAEESDNVIKKASKAAAKKAAEEVELIVKDAVKLDTERATKRAAIEAIRETALIEEPEKIVKAATTEVAKETAEKSAEKFVERDGKRVASKAASEAALEVAERESKKVASKAASEAAKEKAEEVMEKEVKELVKKAATEAVEQVTKTE